MSSFMQQSLKKMSDEAMEHSHDLWRHYSLVNINSQTFINFLDKFNGKRLPRYALHPLRADVVKNCWQHETVKRSTDGELHCKLIQ